VRWYRHRFGIGAIPQARHCRNFVAFEYRSKATPSRSTPHASRVQSAYLSLRQKKYFLRASDFCCHNLSLRSILPAPQQSQIVLPKKPIG
jgi:hypothetical protein